MSPVPVPRAPFSGRILHFTFLRPPCLPLSPHPLSSHPAPPLSRTHDTRLYQATPPGDTTRLPYTTLQPQLPSQLPPQPQLYDLNPNFNYHLNYHLNYDHAPLPQIPTDTDSFACFFFMFSFFFYPRDLTFSRAALFYSSPLSLPLLLFTSDCSLRHSTTNPLCNN